MATTTEEEKYKRKAALLQRALAKADEMDAAGEKKAAEAREKEVCTSDPIRLSGIGGHSVTSKCRKSVYEHTPGEPLADDQYDGMEDMLDDDHLPTDWDPETGDPPHDAWFAHVDSVREEGGS